MTSPTLVNTLADFSGPSYECCLAGVACRSLVSMGERNRCMGASAKNQLVTNVKNTIWGWKKLIGRRFSERVVQSEIPHLTYEVVESKDGQIGIQVCCLEMPSSIATLLCSVCVCVMGSFEGICGSGVQNRPTPFAGRMA